MSDASKQNLRPMIRHDQLNWDDVPVLEEEPDPHQYLQPDEPPQPEISPTFRKKLVEDIHAKVEQGKESQKIAQEGEYETVLSAPIESEVVQPSTKYNGVVIKLWQHTAVHGKEEVEADKAIYLVTYHESTPRADGSFDYYKEPEMCILLRAPELDVPVIWAQAIDSDGSHDESLTDEKALSVDEEIKTAQWLMQAA